MKCFTHRGSDAVGVCQGCGRGLCGACARETTAGLACSKACVEDPPSPNAVAPSEQTASAMRLPRLEAPLAARSAHLEPPLAQPADPHMAGAARPGSTADPRRAAEPAKARWSWRDLT